LLQSVTALQWPYASVRTDQHAPLHSRMLMSVPLSTLFVYGTLKEGEINHGLIEPYARSIRRGWIPGRLYDVGVFPALAEGEDRVQGEIVRLDPTDLVRVLAVIDRLEGCVPDDDMGSLYTRRVVQVTDVDGTLQPAYAYYYNPTHQTLLPLDRLVYLNTGVWAGPTGDTAPSGNDRLDAYRRTVRTFHQNRIGS